MKQAESGIHDLNLYLLIISSFLSSVLCLIFKVLNGIYRNTDEQKLQSYSSGVAAYLVDHFYKECRALLSD